MKKLDFIVKTKSGGIKIPDKIRPAFEGLLKYCTDKRGGFLRVVLYPPFKHRSTGHKSMNHHINGHVQQICNETGEDFDIIKEYAKKKAVKYGYPIRSDIFGHDMPVSETEIDDTQAGYLVDALHEMAAFLNVILNEGGEDETP